MTEKKIRGCKFCPLPSKVRRRDKIKNTACYPKLAK